MTTKAKQAEQTEAITQLRAICPPGTTIYTVLRHVSSSGMSRLIDCYVMQDNEPRWISSLVAKAIGETFDSNKSAIRIGGAGQDMGFAIVHSLSYRLHPDGFECIGSSESPRVRCPSNEHSNGDRDYTPHHHATGGYSLIQRWM